MFVPEAPLLMREKDGDGRRLDAEADEGGALIERGSSSPVADDAETCVAPADLVCYIEQ